MPTASEITIRETLDLLEGQFAEVSKGISNGAYALWLGSGISRNRVIGLDGVLAKLIEFVRARSTTNPHCPYKEALNRIVDLAAPSAAERAQIDLNVPAKDWPCLKDLIPRLWKQYSVVLSGEVAPEPIDFLLWVGLDFRRTFAAQAPDVEHLAIAMLALEGVFSEVATPNWDGLIEAAMTQLGHDGKIFKITVTGDDLRTPLAAQATLYKFHGCARRAIEDETKYRRLIVARSAQIIGWMSNDDFKIVRDQLKAVIQTNRTLMIGLSAQDANIQDLFGRVGAHKGWKWDDVATPIVISAESLGDEQKDLLSVAYGSDYDPNRQLIWDSARIRAYAKPLLIGLLLFVLAEKLKTLLSDVSAPGLDQTSIETIAVGISHLRNKIAEAGDGDRIGLVLAIAGGLARARHQLQDGVSAAGTPCYYPLDSQPSNLMKGKLALAQSGQREAAAALGLIGLELNAANWGANIDDPKLVTSGALRLTSVNSEARVFFAANDDTISTLLDVGAFNDDDDDVVVICSKKVTDRQQRSPSGTFRDGSIGPRYISLGAMLKATLGLDDLRDAFRKEVSV